MIDALFLLKALTSIGIVVALSLIAERLGPRAAGLLTGLPLGAGMVVIFTGIEQGADFAAAAAGHMVPGFITTLVFIYAYALIAERRGAGGVLATAFPLLGAHIGYGVTAWAVGQTVWPMEVAVPVVVLALFIAQRFMRAIPDKPISNRVRFGWGVLAFRAGMATSVILLITGIAAAVGPQWTGILTAYPITLLPVILVLHITYAGGEVASVLKHVPAGLGSVISFCFTVHYSVPVWGLAAGITAGYGVAFAFLLLISKVSRRKRAA